MPHDAPPPLTDPRGLPLLGLGYVGVAATNLDDWRSFATEFAGLQVADAARDRLVLRMDDRRQRLMIRDADLPTHFGWEANGTPGLTAIADRLDAAGVPHRALTRAESADRLIAEGLWFLDPDGNRMEVFADPEVSDEPLRPGRTISGFRTGPLGMGHAVLISPDPGRMVPFYRDVLGFRPSDHTHAPFEAYFFHLNPRHHSFAIVAGRQVLVHHLMVELNNLDDVGQGYDIAQRRPEGVGVTLGRHSNDHMTSFYARTPSKFLLEYGWGGLSLDPETWQDHELVEGPSLWGHDRDWLPPDLREEAVRLRMQAAVDGRRSVVHVQPGNFETNDIAARWAASHTAGKADR